MKTSAFLTTVALAALTTATWAGNLGPGPWANGAYYPGQTDGAYSASVFNDIPVPKDITSHTTNSATNQNSVVSGVLGFGIRSGTPPTSSSGSSFSGSGTSSSIGVDNSLNYFVIFVNGASYAGQTIGEIDLQRQTASGVLFNGIGNIRVVERQQVSGVIVGTNVITVTNPILFSLPGDTANGYFNAKVISDKSPFTFRGPGQITITPSAALLLPVTYNFKLYGLKVSDSASSRATASSSTATP